MTTEKGSTPAASGRADAERRRALDVLEGLRSYLVAESEMQRRSEKSMNLTVNDISALRYLLRARERGIAVGPKELGDYLGIQSSSITVLLDRLEKAGHIRREPSPFDRRALIIVPAVPTDELHRAILGDVREELVDIAATLDDDQARTIIGFLDRLRDATDAIDDARAHPGRPGR
ncbi:MarR family winged helix-turn-helix transcriptional regulator [Leifsonia sp. EB34]|uniref:MarR family winged helix-turn-helix transcriptional regulator n=1 Tax=Leifsonia sp. EB34 TaxID=3156303 RepID=UPI0035127813